jgi:hypothetical protein
MGARPLIVAAAENRQPPPNAPCRLSGPLCRAWRCASHLHLQRLAEELPEHRHHGRYLGVHGRHARGAQRGHAARDVGHVCRTTRGGGARSPCLGPRPEGQGPRTARPALACFSPGRAPSHPTPPGSPARARRWPVAQRGTKEKGRANQAARPGLARLARTQGFPNGPWRAAHGAAHLQAEARHGLEEHGGVLGGRGGVALEHGRHRQAQRRAALRGPHLAAHTNTQGLRER